LSADEINQARDIVLGLYPGALVEFRILHLLEPPKAEVVPFLEQEHNGTLSESTPWPSRLAQARYDVFQKGKAPSSEESVVDLRAAERIKHTVLDSTVSQPGLAIYEFDRLVEACTKSPAVQAKLKEIKFPEGLELVIEPWPYGGQEADEKPHRYFQALCYAQDTRTGNPDSNFYAFPVPIIPVYDIYTGEIVRIDEPATGGANDSFHSSGIKAIALNHQRPAEYVPELLPNGVRKDLKPLEVHQPDGPSFAVSDGNLVEWQKWRMRVTFNAREGAVLHDIRYDGRDVCYRLSLSDMTVPYADPRFPFARKQAFDFGDGALGHTVNNLELGCDCLGVIKYFDGVLIDLNGTATPTKNVICLHEQDNGINWKHTNWRTNRAVVTRRRELVFQYIITLANYEYIFAFKFDQAAGITVEARATGIVSVVSIDEGKTAPWGNVVNPGALAQNHQHIFAVRIDPAVDGHKNTLVQEDSLPMHKDKDTNPYGNRYEVRKQRIGTSTGLDLNPFTNRVFKVQNQSKVNPISGNYVGYKVSTPATQLLLADEGTLQSNRARFARHGLWVTKYQDDELYAGGRYTYCSEREIDGLADAAARKDDIVDEDIVLWSVFGLTHNPRVEDWPVM
jgi:primary-amine oxidase